MSLAVRSHKPEKWDRHNERAIVLIYTAFVFSNMYYGL